METGKKAHQKSVENTKKIETIKNNIFTKKKKHIVQDVFSWVTHFRTFNSVYVSVRPKANLNPFSFEQYYQYMCSSFPPYIYIFFILYVCEQCFIYLIFFSLYPSFVLSFSIIQLHLSWFASFFFVFFFFLISLWFFSIDFYLNFSLNFRFEFHFDKQNFFRCSIFKEVNEWILLSSINVSIIFDRVSGPGAFFQFFFFCWSRR